MFNEAHCSGYCRGSVVIVAIGYGLDGTGFEHRWEKEIFSSSNPFRPALVPVQPPVQQVPWLFPRGNAAWRGVANPPSFSAEFRHDLVYTSTPPLCFQWHVTG
jgi:hypothetical protein